MAFGLTLTVHEPPLDVPALEDFLARLPPLPADRLHITVAPPHVSIAFRWSDTRCGHGAAVGAWILDRHRCSGQDHDWGTRLPDNAACADHLARASGTRPSTPARASALLTPLLVGSHPQTLQVNGEGFRTTWQRDEALTGGLWLCRTWAVVTLHDWPEPPLTEPELPDRLVLGVLYDLLDACGVWPLVAAEVGWRVPLTLRWADGRALVIDAAPDAPDGSLIWSIEDTDGQSRILTHAGEGPCVLEA